MQTVAAMPVVLTNREKVEKRLTAPPNEPLTLQRPLPEDALRIVARESACDDQHSG